MPKANLRVLHTNHVDWRKELDFYYEQIGRFEKLLGEISSKNTINQVRPQIEQFQNKFIVHRDVIDRLEHEIKMQENELAQAMRMNPTKASHTHFQDQEMMYDRMNDFVKKYNDLKKSFVQFSEDWM